MLPDGSILIWQKLVENAKIENLKCDILSDFQTFCDPILRLLEWFCTNVPIARYARQNSKNQSINHSVRESLAWEKIGSSLLPLRIALKVESPRHSSKWAQETPREKKVQLKGDITLTLEALLICGNFNFLTVWFKLDFSFAALQSRELKGQ